MHHAKRFFRLPSSTITTKMKLMNVESEAAELPEALPYAWLGHRPYEPVWRQLQQRAIAIARQGAPEIIWACEHDPVYTTGRRAIDNRHAPSLPAPLVITDRGGETTWHGPGQVMLYPLLNLKRRRIKIRQYVYLLEQACILLLADYGVMAGRRDDLPGVWVDGCKIAAIGLRVRDGVTYHGMALNVHCDLSWFSAIDPCGTGLAACRLQDMVGDIPDLETIAAQWQVYLQRSIV